MTVLIVAAAAMAAGWMGTGLVRRYALEKNVLDVPNARSSHRVPTPRGGGMAIVLTSLAAVAALALLGVLPWRVGVALGVGGLAVAAVGWVDDHGGVSAPARALVHFAAAAWAVGWLGGLPAARLGAGTLPLGPLGAVLAVVGVVWMTNLYNFMDGIDGLAGGEAVTTGVIGGGLLLAAGEPGLAAAALAVTGASAGFLVWNWHPARIFMGDVGSGFLGFAFATLAVASERAGAVPLLAWVLLLGAFVFDATATLLRRARAGEAWHQAHRSHAYQRAVQAGLSHARVSAAVVAVNLVLGGLAAAAWRRPEWLVPALAAGLALLAVLYLRVERLYPMRRAAVPAGKQG
ncbi:MAG TPA: glycosyltransferase family 4 protein [Longimicrobium sp.]|nr:glycosyltransferase family 4 protein [Longimicrobium sp.]